MRGRIISEKYVRYQNHMQKTLTFIATSDTEIHKKYGSMKKKYANQPK